MYFPTLTTSLLLSLLSLTAATPLTTTPRAITNPIAANITVYNSSGCFGTAFPVKITVPSNGACKKSRDQIGIPAGFVFESFKVLDQDLAGGCNVTAWTDATCSSVFNFVVVGKNEPQKPGSCEQPGPQVLSFSAAC